MNLTNDMSPAEIRRAILGGSMLAEQTPPELYRGVANAAKERYEELLRQIARNKGKGAPVGELKHAAGRNKALEATMATAATDYSMGFERSYLVGATF